MMWGAGGQAVKTGVHEWWTCGLGREKQKTGCKVGGENQCGGAGKASAEGPGKQRRELELRGGAGGH